MSLMTRRRMMGTSEQAEDVRFWMSGKDAPINEGTVYYWVERVQGLPFRLVNWSYDTTNKLYDFHLGEARAGNLDTGTAYSFDNHWRLDFDGDFFVYTNRQTDKFFLDFGSVTSAQHAFGFHIAISTVQTTVGINWKLTGNDSDPGVWVLNHSFLAPSSYVSGDYIPIRGYYLIEDAGNGYDRLTVSLNGVTETYSTNIPKARYIPPWQNRRVGVGSSEASPGYKSFCKLRELKMVVID